MTADLPKEQQESGTGVNSQNITSHNRRSWLYMGLAAFVLAGVIYAFGVYPGQKSNAEISDWANVQVKVLESSLKEEQKTEPWGNSQREYTVYIPQIKYEYTYQGDSFTGDKVALTQPQYRNPAEADAIIKKFSQGTTHDAWVNPDTPSEAVLQSVDRSVSVAFLIAIAMMILLGIFGVMLSLVKIG